MLRLSGITNPTVQIHIVVNSFWSRILDLDDDEGNSAIEILGNYK
jgi:hypothetical protein